MNKLINIIIIKIITKSWKNNKNSIDGLLESIKKIDVHIGIK
jgi:hypothetical protein